MIVSLLAVTFLECVNGTYGINCADQCGYCDSGMICDRFSGHCPDGCSAGYIGDFCIDGKCNLFLRPPPHPHAATKK
jgi:hypothetical protein